MVGVRFLAWFLVISLACTLSSIASLKTPTKLAYYNQVGVNLTKPVLQEGKNYGIASLNPTKFESSLKAQKGRGVYGGANIAHRRPNEKNSASLPARAHPLSMILLTIVILLCSL